MDLLRLVTLAIVATVNLGLALAVFVRNRRSPANRAFAAAVTAIVLWLVAAFLSDQEALRPAALVLNRLTFGSAVAMGGLLLYFLTLFPTYDSRNRLVPRLFFAATTVVGLLTVLTPWMIKGVTFEEWGTNVVGGRLFGLMAAWMLTGILSIVYISGRKYRRSEGRERTQLKLVFLGFALFTVLSLAFGLVLPMITGSYEMSHLNTFATLALVGFTAYAMSKHRFMDVRLVVLRAVVYTILVASMGALLVAAAALARASILKQFGVNADALFVGTCLVAIFVFQPARRAVEHFTDHIFFRKTFDPQALATSLGSAMAATVELDELARLLASELTSGMRLTFAAVVYNHADRVDVETTGSEIAQDDAQRLLLVSSRGRVVYTDDADTDPAAVELLSECGVRALVPLVSEGVVIAVVLLGAKLNGEMFTTNDDSFLQILSGEASIAMKNAHLFDERNQRVRELSALNTMSNALGRDMQLDSVLERALKQVMRVTGAECGSIMLLDQASQSLSIRAADGLPAHVVEQTCTRMGEGIAGWVAQHRKALVLVDAVDSGFGRELEREGLRSALCVPLVRKGAVTGVLNISRRQSSEAFSRENLKVVTAFAGQLAVAIENAKLYEDLENTFLGTIGALAAAVDAKDPYTFGHSSDVTQYSLAIAAEMRISDADTERLRIAALLHDIGKIGIDSSILNKPGTLTDEEYQVIKSHPDIAANILGTLEFLDDVVPLVHHHHEYFGGGGYPFGIAGDEIPLGARIIAVADAFNAMTSDRPYRQALSEDLAIEELRRNAGTQFDPDVVNAFCRAHERSLVLDLKVSSLPTVDPGVEVRAV